MKRLLRRLAACEELLPWDGDPQALAPTRPLTKGLLTPDDRVYVWHDYDCHHATAQEVLNEADCAHLLVDAQAGTVEVEYPRGAQALCAAHGNLRTWYDYYKQNSDELFAADVATLQGELPGWTVTRRQFDNTARRVNRLRRPR